MTLETKRNLFAFGVVVLFVIMTATFVLWG